jgi:hypothetical protein
VVGGARALSCISNPTDGSWWIVQSRPTQGGSGFPLFIFFSLRPLRVFAIFARNALEVAGARKRNTHRIRQPLSM